jgi:hypothetical protein
MADDRQADSTQGAFPGVALPESRLVRIALGVFGLVLVAAVVAGIAFVLMRAGRNEPLEIEMVPGAQRIANEVLTDHSDHQQYVSTAPVEEIVAAFARQDDMVCHDQYVRVVDQPDGEPLREGYLYTSCLIDRSWLDMTQYNEITIQPQYDADGQATGEVLIDVRRYWGN